MIDSAESPVGCATCISRRTFVAQASLAAAALAFLTSCGEGGISEPTGKVEINVAQFPALATPGPFALVDGQRAVKRTGSTTFAAFSRRCTHEGTAIGLDTPTTFVCPNHGARFDNNGTVTAGPANRPLTQLPTSYDAATNILTIG